MQGRGMLRKIGKNLTKEAVSEKPRSTAEVGIVPQGRRGIDRVYRTLALCGGGGLNSSHPNGELPGVDDGSVFRGGGSGAGVVLVAIEVVEDAFFGKGEVVVGKPAGFGKGV